MADPVPGRPATRQAWQLSGGRQRDDWPGAPGRGRRALPSPLHTGRWTSTWRRAGRRACAGARARAAPARDRWYPARCGQGPGQVPGGPRPGGDPTRAVGAPRPWPPGAGPPGAGPAGGSYGPPPGPAKGGKRRIVRDARSRRLVRKVDTWTVLKVSLTFYCCVLVVLIVAGILLWNVAAAFGVIDTFDKLVRSLFALTSFRIHPFAALIWGSAAAQLYACSGRCATS